MEKVRINFENTRHNNKIYAVQLHTSSYHTKNRLLYNLRAVIQNVVFKKHDPLTHNKSALGSKDILNNLK